MRNDWISVNDRKPTCKRDQNAIGTPVLIWPRNPSSNPYNGLDGFAYYGRRATGRLAFYLYGAEIRGVTHWMPMPDGPEEVPSDG
jgi:hypothetical protein